ncbi:MAG: sigma-70 family RNA polymerase sigma factor [Brumimicrobium sp.]|nr:sigma-70 family RNA polymerase sigma factor [Brumimicrobium sp.]MCO5269813.1 sigma-70 family RNA polymerase sigma factor [Brumimicrobium sp.]
MTKDQATLTDSEIIERVLKGEKSLYEVIIRKYNPYLYKIGRSYNYNHEDTEDLMQDTYIDAYKSLNQFENRSNFKTWVTRIMLNNCYRKREKSSFKNEFSEENLRENVTPMYANTSNDTLKMVHNSELAALLEEALSKVPENYRMVFTLREMNGYSVEETAKLLDITEANVKVRLNRAKTMLQEFITQSHEVTELYEFNAVLCNPFTARVMDKINKLD